MAWNPRAAIHSATTSINPDIDGVLITSTGYTLDATYAPVPAYIESPVKLQLQELSADDIRFAGNNMIPLQGISQCVFLYAAPEVIDRLAQTGGDLLRFDGADWLTIFVKERWPGWSKVIVRKQVNPVPTA